MAWHLTVPQQLRTPLPLPLPSPSAPPLAHCRRAPRTTPSSPPPRPSLLPLQYLLAGEDFNLCSECGWMCKHKGPCRVRTPVRVPGSRTFVAVSPEDYTTNVAMAVAISRRWPMHVLGCRDAAAGDEMLPFTHYPIQARGWPLG